MLLDEAHEEPDDQYGDDERDEAADAEDGELCGRERVALEEELHEAQPRGTHHDGDCEVERELCRDGARAAEQQATDDGGAGTRGARHHGEHLEDAYADGRSPTELAHALDAGVDVCQRGLAGRDGLGVGLEVLRAGLERPLDRDALRLVLTGGLDDDERDAVGDERGRDDERAAEVIFHPIVQRDADEGRRQARDDDLPPQPPGALALLRGLRPGERVQRTEEHDAHGEDGAELDDDEEHVPEVLGDVQRHELAEQEHVSRARDGQPLRDALDEPVQGRLQKFDDVQAQSPLAYGGPVPATCPRPSRPRGRAPPRGGADEADSIMTFCAGARRNATRESCAARRARANDRGAHG